MAQQDIVGGLFGMTPEMYQQNIARQSSADNLTAAQLTPGQLAGFYAMEAGTGLGRAAQGLLGVQDPQMQLISRTNQLVQEIGIDTPEKLRTLAGELQKIPGGAQLANQAVQRAADLEQTIATTGLRQAQTEKALSTPSVSPEQLLTSGRYTPASVAKYQASGNIADLVLTKEATGGDGIGKLSPAQRAADTAFGKEYNDFVAGGGITTIQKNLADLDKAIDALEKSPQGDITGKLIGLSDKAGTLSFTNPKAAEIKDIVGGVVQSNLRAVLGGQFAQKEGEALLARAYNPAQPQKDNLNRLKAIRQQIANTGQAKLQAVSEFEEKGTLKDFKASNVREAQIDNTKKKKTTKTLKSGVTVEIEE
jgi:hypothetical protein